MRQFHRQITAQTPGPGLHDITGEVAATVRQADIATGLLTLFVRHTSASLTIQENADPDVLADLQDFFADIAPRARPYRHNAEGPDDMPAHIRAALTQTSLSVPISDSRPVLGTWQGIYLFEHRDRSHRRMVACHLLGD